MRGMEDTGDLLLVDGLRVDFPSDDGVVRAVRGLSYRLRAGEVLGIVGESGSGKSVAGLAVLGLLPRSARVSGQVLFQGQDVLRMPPAVRRGLRGRAIAMIFQDPATALNPVRTVGDQLAEAVLAHEVVSRRQAWDRAAGTLATVGIADPRTRLRSYPHELSGGMRQRVMIAMAIINHPDVVVADEPTTALDVTVQAQILETLLDVTRAAGTAVVLITHDLGVVAEAADRVLVMYAGRAVELGDTGEVFGRTRMPYTAGLLGSVPSIDRDGRRLRPIAGAPPSLVDLPPGCPFAVRCPLATEACRQAEPVLRPTETADHLAACHHWDRLAAAADPTAFFRSDPTQAR